MRMKGHVALALPSLRGGGAERVMVNLAEEFARRDLRVDLVLAQATGEYLSGISSAVRVVDLHAGHVSTALPAFVRYLRQSRPDAVLSGLDHMNLMVLLGRLMARVNSRIVISIHNPMSVKERVRRRRAALIPALARRLFVRADAVVAVSRAVAEDVERVVRLPKGIVDVIHNPVVHSGIRAMAAMPLDHPWFSKDGPPVILSAGRLTGQKDFPTLIRAFTIVRQRMNARLAILGDGPDRGTIMELVEHLGLQNDVWLPGFVANPYAYMARAAVFALSSVFEGFGNVLVEAMAVGTPVVSTNCPGGPAEILCHGRLGPLVPPGDPMGLAGAIISTLSGPTARDALIRRSTEFEVAVVADRYLALLFDHGAGASTSCAQAPAQG